ncbi:MAG: serine/threonine protein kinase, partial [Armatimonadetes bacterium]|nr:serine/threonine protein kinase [Anaerolineae bacterium]
MIFASQLIGRRYLLGELLGQGGMGVVYDATDRLTGQAVALKRVLSAQRPAAPAVSHHSTDLRLALASEFKVLASLRHPHIISVLDYGFDDQNQPFLTLELLRDHRTIIEWGAALPIAERVRLLMQMLEALAYLHRRGILHRDLKPANVMVMDGQVKVLDFGLALLRSDVPEESVVGTLTYLAPEVLMGERASQASDLYAVGVLAYELLVGRHPFATANITDLMLAVISADVDLTPLTDLLVTPEDESSPLPPIIQRLLAKQPAERYQDAAQVLLDFSAALRQPTPRESIAIRESFLQAAKFVGRQAEYTQLTAALE